VADAPAHVADEREVALERLAKHQERLNAVYFAPTAVPSRDPALRRDSGAAREAEARAEERRTSSAAASTSKAPSKAAADTILVPSTRRGAKAGRLPRVARGAARARPAPPRAAEAQAGKADEAAGDSAYLEEMRQWLQAARAPARQQRKA
jgi:hypothetical protein